MTEVTIFVATQEKMDDRALLALDNHKKGYNCAQAVACAFVDKTYMKEADLLRLTEGFGGGMGCMDGTCGAVTGAVMIASLAQAKEDSDVYIRGGAGKCSKQIVTEFGKKNGSVVCREIKGIDTGKVLRSCPGCIEDAARLTSEILDAE